MVICLFVCFPWIPDPFLQGQFDIFFSWSIIYLRRGKKYHFRDCSQRGKKNTESNKWIEEEKRGTCIERLGWWDSGSIIDGAAVKATCGGLPTPPCRHRGRGEERAAASCCFFYSFHVASLDSVRTARSNDRRWWLKNTPGSATLWIKKKIRFPSAGGRRHFSPRFFVFPCWMSWTFWIFFLLPGVTKSY